MSDSNQKCEGCDCVPATTYDSEGIPLCEVCASLPAVPDVKEEEKTLEEPGDTGANTVQGQEYRKRPVVITAQQFLEGEPIPKGVCFGGRCGNYDPGAPHVHTIHDNQRCDIVFGDWIIPEPDGEHYYPVKPDIFWRTYEQVSSVPEQSKSEAASEFPQTRFETGGRNALNLQVEWDDVKAFVQPAVDSAWNDHAPNRKPAWGRTISESQAFHIAATAAERACKALLQDARAASDGKEQGEKSLEERGGQS